MKVAGSLVDKIINSLYKTPQIELTTTGRLIS